MSKPYMTRCVTRIHFAVRATSDSTELNACLCICTDGPEKLNNQIAIRLTISRVRSFRIRPHLDVTMTPWISTWQSLGALGRLLQIVPHCALGR